MNIEVFNLEEYNYLIKLFQVALRCRHFLDLNIDEICSLLKDDHLNVVSEELTFEAAMHWVDHDSPNRSQFVPRLLSSMRLGLIPLDVFTEKIAAHSLVKENWSSCCFLIQQVTDFLQVDIIIKSPFYKMHT